MNKFIAKNIISPEIIKTTLEKELGSEVNIIIKPNYIKITQGLARGCIIRYENKDGKTIGSLHGYMPSLILSLVLVIGYMVILSVIVSFLSNEKTVVFALGLIPLLYIKYFILPIPSTELVRKTTQALALVDDGP